MPDNNEFTQVNTIELNEMITQLTQYKTDEFEMRQAVNILENDFGLITAIKNMEGKGAMSIMLSDIPKLMRKMTANPNSNAFPLLGKILSKYANK